MQASDIFSKTPRGQAEIGEKTDALTMKERRVLILVNGEHDVAALERMSLSDDINSVLGRLLELDFISGNETTQQTLVDAKEAGSEVDPREFMEKMLLTFGNRVRVAGLIEKIHASEDVESLKTLVQPWYQEISDTPGGMYQADDLKQELLTILDQ